MNDIKKNLGKKHNSISLRFSPCPANESFARIVVAAFFAQLNPTFDELEDVKTAVSEAVTNSIIHGYGGFEDELMEIKIKCPVSEKEKVRKTKTDDEWIQIDANLYDDTIDIMVQDWGCGILDVGKAMEPMFTTKPSMERSGMGFVFMEAFMDTLRVESEPMKGTCVYMSKKVMKDTLA